MNVAILCSAISTCLLAGCASSGSGDQETPAQNSLNRAQAHMELGIGYYETGKYQFALEELNEALKAKPDYVSAHNGLGLVYAELKQDKQAEESFKKALRYGSENPSTQNNYGQFLCSRGRTQEGLGQLLAATRNSLYETPDVAFKNAGQCARRDGNLDKAEEYFRQAVMRNPRQTQSLYNLGELGYMKKNYPQAKAYIDRLLQNIETPGADVLWLATRIGHKLGDQEGVRRYSAELRRRYPESVEFRAMTEGRFE
jgi:type IV pilus assembly protein PilF